MQSEEQPVKADPLTQLLSERFATAHRLATLDSRIESTYAMRQQELDQRMQLIEAALRLSQPAHQPAARTDGSEPTTAGPQVSAPSQSAAAESPNAVPDSTPTPPRRLGIRLTNGEATLWFSPGKQGRKLRLPAGTEVMLTDARQNGRVQVLYQGQELWMEPLYLSLPATPPLASNQQAAKSAVQPVEEAAAHLAGTPASSKNSAGGAEPGAAPPSGKAAQPSEATASPKAPDQAAEESAKSKAPDQAAEESTKPKAPDQPDQAAPEWPTMPTAPKRPPLWERPGFLARVLALTGAAVTLIGIGFLLVLAAQYGFFGPGARTISAALLGVLLIVLAFVVRKRDVRNAGAPILAATGIAAGFLSVVTASAIYHWLSPLVGAILTVAVGLGGMVLARHWQNQWVAIVSTLGGLGLAAWVGSDALLASAGLMVLMTAVTLWFERGTGWLLFPFARVFPTVLVVLALVDMLSSDAVDPNWVAFLAVVLALLGWLSALIAAPEPRVGQVIALCLLAPMLLPVALLPGSIDLRAAALPLGIVAVAYAVAGFVPKVHPNVRTVMMPIGALFILMTIFSLTSLSYLQVMGAALGLVYLAVVSRTRSKVALIIGAVLASLGALVWVPQLQVLFGLGTADLYEPRQVFLALICIAAIFLMVKIAIRRPAGIRTGWFQAAWALGILMGATSVVITGTLIGGLANNAVAGYQTGQALVTCGGMVLGAVFLKRALAVRQGEALWLRMALVLFALSVAKLFLLDLSMLDAIARIGAFLVVGLLLLFVGTRYARAWEEAHRPHREPDPDPESSDEPVAAGASNSASSGS